jgi:signal transduction histidine kinase
VAASSGPTSVRAAARPGRSSSSADELSRAFENVVRNAVEAAGRGGLSRFPPGVRGLVDILVEDDGPALPRTTRDVRPFYTTRPGGLGLGLPLARKIVLLHGGALRLEGGTSGGVRVTVSLPAGGPEAQLTRAAG